MLDGVLHKRLQRERRHELGPQVHLEVGSHHEALPEANLLDSEIPRYELPFVSERDFVALLLETPAQQLRHHLGRLCGTALIDMNELDDGMQRVEQEVRLQLRP